MRMTMWAGVVLGAAMGAVLVPPAAADDSSGTVSITFDKRAWSAITSEVDVVATGKAEPIGQCCPCGPPRADAAVAACCPCVEDRLGAGASCETAGEAARSFSMPALLRNQNTVTTKGGLRLSRADAGLRIENLVIDLRRRSATVREGQRRHRMLTLSNVKRGAFVAAQVHLAKGEAAMLNDALKTDVFTARMRLGQVVYTAG